MQHTASTVRFIPPVRPHYWCRRDVAESTPGATAVPAGEPRGASLRVGLGGGAIGDRAAGRARFPRELVRRAKQTYEEFLMSAIDVEALKASIREVPDFPKKGILFYDITTLLKDPALLRG